MTENNNIIFLFISSPDLMESEIEYMKDILFAEKGNGDRWEFASLELFK